MAAAAGGGWLRSMMMPRSPSGDAAAKPSHSDAKGARDAAV